MVDFARAVFPCRNRVFTLVISCRRQGKAFNIGGRAVLSRTQSTDRILEHHVGMQELKKSEARGVDNKTFSQVYEESDGHTLSDLDDGAFMVENQVSRKPDREYMKEVRIHEHALWLSIAGLFRDL